MNGLAGSIPGAMHVRALYDYDADDRTSLSFRQGDIIQVITQLESGWWDGIINGVRGWFPSNYCEVISAPSDDGREGQVEFGVSGLDNAEESDADYGDNELSLLRSQANGSRVHLDSADSQEEAAFWIPQATPDGRLFYFNTLTGVSTMELPMETPTFINETGPRHSSNVYIPDQTRPPAEMLAGGYEREEDAEDESSEAGMTMASRASMVRTITSQRQFKVLKLIMIFSSPAIVSRTFRMVFLLAPLWNPSGIPRRATHRVEIMPMV